MVVVQIALSLVLLIGAGLFLRSLRNLKTIAPGFDPQHLAMLSVNPSLSGYQESASWALTDAVLEIAQHLPGVVAASWSRASPLEGAASVTDVKVPGYRSNEPPIAWLNGVGPNYFKALDTPVLVGRAFMIGDAARSVTIVNETTAAQFWPHQNALGSHIVIGTHDCEVIGIVIDAKYLSLRQDIPATAYVPLRMHPPINFTLHIRVLGETAPVIAALTRQIRELDRDLPIYNATTMEAQLDNSIALDRLTAALRALFGLVAVMMAAVGLYGVMAYMVAARTREIGIRMALGAGRGRALRQVVRESAVLTGIGVAVGVPAALLASRAVGSFLYGLSATDPWTYVVLALVLAGIALGAAWAPARRAAGVDPMVALRYE
jgi:predicted permease